MSELLDQTLFKFQAYSISMIGYYAT